MPTKEPLQVYIEDMQTYQSKAHDLAILCQLTREIEKAHESADKLKKLVDEINLDPEVLRRI